MRRVQKRLHEIHPFGRKFQREKKAEWVWSIQMVLGRQLRIFVTDTLTYRFVFSALLTKLSGFAKILFPSLGSDRTSKIRSLSDRSNVCLLSGLCRKMSVSDRRKSLSLSLSLSAASDWTPFGLLCRLLIWSKAEYRQLLALAHEYVNRLDHYAFSNNLWNSAGDCFSSGTKNEFGFPAEFSAASNQLSQSKPTYLVLDLGSGFRSQTTQNPIHHLSWDLINELIHQLPWTITSLNQQIQPLKRYSKRKIKYEIPFFQYEKNLFLEWPFYPFN